MFSESMLSMPASRVEEPERMSYWPAFLAIGCAWLIALLRGILGVARHEGLDLDMALTALAVTAIPVIVLHIWRVERHRSATSTSDSSRRQRPRLVLISNH
jgi:hypothetical protein